MINLIGCMSAILISMSELDATDRRILSALEHDPRATVQALSQRLGLARGTVHARIERLQNAATLRAHSLRIDPTALGWPMRAKITVETDQELLNHMIADLEQIPEIIECLVVSGGSDLALEVVARDSDDIYRITQKILDCRGVIRTSTSIVLRELIERRQHQLL